MTAIDKYTRLEALGQWRESPDHPPREVVVSFGNATLVLSDLKEKPLCHWAMAATSRISLEGSKAVYTPDTEGFETLEIDDAQMVEAIAQVSRASVVVKQRKPWLRWVFLAILILVISTVFYITPTMLQGQATRMTGAESARKLGTDMLATLNPDICREPRADTARALFQSRVFPNNEALLVIARNQPQPHAFPGGVFLIGADTLQAMQSPNDLANLATTLTAKNNATLDQLFEESSMRELFEYITTGKMSEERLAKAAQEIVDEPDNSQTVETATATQPLLRDQDWVALQGICLE